MKWLLLPLAVALIASGCATSHSTNNTAGTSFVIVHTNFLGTLWSESHARASIISQDGGQSFPVPGGALWAFGDTFKGTRSADGAPQYAGGSVSCAIAFLAQGPRTYPPALDYLRSTNGVISPFQFLPDETPASRYRIWPLGGIYLNGRFYLYYSLIEVFGSGAWNFRGVGSGLAQATNVLDAYERLRPNGNWRFPLDPTQVLEADGWLYLYAIGGFSGQQGVELARVRPDNIENPAAYEFYAGPGPKFSPHKSDAACLVSNVPGQVSVAWNPYLQKYVMASSSDFYRPREIRFLLADTPTGPWSKPVATVQVPTRRQNHEVNLIYGTFLHPELFHENGRIMNLTYSLDLKDSGFDANCEMLEIEIK